MCVCLLRLHRSRKLVSVKRKPSMSKELFALRVNARAIIDFSIIHANTQIQPPERGTAMLRTAIRG